jgi:DnaJ-class molecular chaperone
MIHPRQLSTERCPDCKGDKRCHICKGAGEIRQPEGTWARAYVKCYWCDGDKACPSCGGEGSL